MRPTSTHDVPDNRCTTTTRPARAGYPYPDNANARAVSTETGATNDTACLTTVKTRVTDIACAADTVGRATARHDVFDPANPARTEPEKRPVELVVTDNTVDHDGPYRCNHTVRPDDTGETTPESTTDSAGAATDGTTLSDTVEATAACAGNTPAKGETIARTATPAIATRARNDRPARTPNLPTTHPFNDPQHLACHDQTQPPGRARAPCCQTQADPVTRLSDLLITAFGCRQRCGTA